FPVTLSRSTALNTPSSKNRVTVAVSRSFPPGGPLHVRKAFSTGQAVANSASDEGTVSPAGESSPRARRTNASAVCNRSPMVNTSIVHGGTIHTWPAPARYRWLTTTRSEVAPRSTQATHGHRSNSITLPLADGQVAGGFLRQRGASRQGLICSPPIPN